MYAKKIGFVILAISLILAGVMAFYAYKLQQFGVETCPALIEGKPCPYHQENPLLFFTGFAFIIAILFGIGLLFIFYYGKEEQKMLRRINAKEHEEKSKERFELAISGLDKDEKKVISAVKEQDGISQSTLALRTDLHKTKLSLVLKTLEDKGFIKKVSKGKINQIYLKKNI